MPFSPTTVKTAHWHCRCDDLFCDLSYDLRHARQMNTSSHGRNCMCPLTFADNKLELKAMTAFYQCVSYKNVSANNSCVKAGYLLPGSKRLKKKAVQMLKRVSVCCWWTQHHHQTGQHFLVSDWQLWSKMSADAEQHCWCSFCFFFQSAVRASRGNLFFVMVQLSVDSKESVSWVSPVQLKWDHYIVIVLHCLYLINVLK